MQGEAAAMPLAGLIDFAAEKARLTKEADKLRIDIEKTDAKLANADFVARAPEEVIEENKARRAAAAAALKRLAEPWPLWDSDLTSTRSRVPGEGKTAATPYPLRLKRPLSSRMTAPLISSSIRRARASRAGTRQGARRHPLPRASAQAVRAALRQDRRADRRAVPRAHCHRHNIRREFAPRCRQARPFIPEPPALAFRFVLIEEVGLAEGRAASIGVTASITSAAERSSRASPL